MSRNGQHFQLKNTDAGIDMNAFISREAVTIDHIKKSLHPLRQRLLHHEVYDRVKTLSQLRIYMEHHVFAVWDFMSLLKALQQKLTCVTLPWVPTSNTLSRRFINEIVLSEESDTISEGVYRSHFEIYLSGMVQCGANTGAIERFLRLLEAGAPVRKALRLARVPRAAQAFVKSTFQIIETGNPHMIAAAFALGREEVIPDMFRSLTAGIYSSDPQRISIFKNYLERHIALDGDHHTPMAIAMLLELCEEDPRKLEEAGRAAYASLLARIKLWDGVMTQLTDETVGPAVPHRLIHRQSVKRHDD